MGILKVEIVLFRFFILQKTTTHQGDLLGLILKIVICNISLSMVEMYFLYITHTHTPFLYLLHNVLFQMTESIILHQKSCR